MVPPRVLASGPKPCGGNYSSGKIKRRKKSLGEENEKKTGPKKKEKHHFVKQRNNLAESDKGSWSGKTPWRSSGSAEDPERSKTLLARAWTLPLPLASLPIITWSA